jgi:hypothetical protein
MSREDFVTIPPRQGLSYSNKNESPWRSAIAPDPKLVVILDPKRMPDAIAKALEGPDSHWIMHAVVGDRRFKSRSESLSDDLELRAQTPDEIADGPRWCAICKTPFMFRGLDFFWNGMPMCDDCPPEDWRDIQRGGYGYARTRAVEIKVIDDDYEYYGNRHDGPLLAASLGEGGHMIELWEEAIADYVEQLGANE